MADHKQTTPLLCFSVLTLNIKYCEHVGHKPDLLAPVLAASGAGVLCLQEVDVGVERSGYNDQIEPFMHDFGVSHDQTD